MRLETPLAEDPSRVSHTTRFTCGFDYPMFKVANKTEINGARMIPGR